MLPNRHPEYLGVRAVCASALDQFGCSPSRKLNKIVLARGIDAQCVQVTESRITHERKLEGKSQAGEVLGRQGLVYGVKRKPTMPASHHGEDRTPPSRRTNKRKNRRAHSKTWALVGYGVVQHQCQCSEL